jgi:hypothetical protein
VTKDLKSNIILKQAQDLDPHNIKTFQVIHSKRTNMRTKGNYHVKNYRTFKLFMHFYFAKEFHIIYQHKIHTKLTKNSKHAPHLIGKLTPKKLHGQGHLYAPKLKDRITSPFSQNHAKKAHKLTKLKHIYLWGKFPHIIAFKNKYQVPKMDHNNFTKL